MTDYVQDNVGLIRANTASSSLASGVISENTIDAYVIAVLMPM